MTAPPITVTPDARVSDVAALLIERRISAVPVVDQNGRIVGIVSEGDLLRRAETGTERQRSKWLELLLEPNIKAAEFVKAHGVYARDVMTRDVATVGPDADLADIATLLESRRIKRVPVVEDSGEVVGIVSRANLLHALVAYRSGSPSTERKASDTELRNRIYERIENQIGGRLRRVNVVVQDGVVFLWGTVRSENERRALTVAAEGVPGVTRVEDKLHRDWFPSSFGG
jgi:CBS domain-containing protein